MSLVGIFGTAILPVVAIAAGVLVFTLVMTTLAGGVGRLIGEREPVLGTLVLVSAFPNSGNYGIPVSEFAFGPTGRATAVAFLAAQSIVIYTLGVYVAARGDDSEWREGVRTVLSVPLVYAAVGALLRALGAVPPTGTAAMETVGLVGDSAIPLMLLILGIELADTDYAAALYRVSPAAGLKLVVAPVVGAGVALGISFASPTVARVFVLECAMPAAVTPLVLAGEFSGPGEDLSPTEYASTAILVTTLASVPLLTGLIALLQFGILF